MTHEFQHDGVKYSLSPVNNLMKEKIRDHLFQQDVRAHVLMRDAYSPEDHWQKLMSCREDYSLGKYDLISKLGIAWSQSPGGMVKIASLIFGVDEYEMMKLIVARGSEINPLIQTIMRESLPHVKPV